MTRPRGFTVIEIIVGIAITGILIAAVTALSGRFFTVSRQQFEQTRTTEDARVQLERMTDIIRNARQQDCDGNSAADQAGEWWLQAAEQNRLSIYSNVDSDSATEKVTYEYIGNEIIRTIDQDTSTTCAFMNGTPQIVAHSIHNASAQPVFSFIGANGRTLPYPVAPQEAVRIRLQLIVDVQGNDLSNAASIVTEITPRLGQYVAIASATPSSTPLESVTPTPASPTPTPSIIATTSSDNIRLLVHQGPLFKPAPEKSTTGPIIIDEGEQWQISIEYTDGSAFRRIDPADPDLSFSSSNQSIVTVATSPKGRLFGQGVGTASVTAYYKSEMRTFVVKVEAGCWGFSTGAWIKPAATDAPQSIAQLCTSAGYRQYICGRTCESDPYAQPGSDVVIYNFKAGREIVQQCSAPIRPLYGAQRLTHIFCSS